MGTKNNPGTYDCYEKAEPDEPMFILLARDETAPRLVRDWAALEALSPNPSVDKIQEALACADNMETWRKANR